MKLWIKILFVFLLFAFISPNQKVEAWPGCCSHHKGVCGCGCCDGTGLSSTCAPHYPKCSDGEVDVVPTSKPILTNKPLPTIRPTSTPKPTLTPRPTLVPTLTIAPSQTETVLPTQPIIPTSVRVPQTKSIESQSIFSRFFNWILKRH